MGRTREDVGSVDLPPRPPETKEVIESKLIPCERCGTVVATNGKSAVALALEPDDEVLQIKIGESGTVPRQSTGIFKISNQHADYSACCLPQEKP